MELFDHDRIEPRIPTMLFLALITERQSNSVLADSVLLSSDAVRRYFSNDEKVRTLNRFQKSRSKKSTHLM